MQRDWENLVQTKQQISQEKPKKVLKKIPNWKAHELDGFQGILLKNFTSLHEKPCMTPQSSPGRRKTTMDEQYLHRKINQRERSKELPPHYMSSLDMETVYRNNYWWNLWFSSERMDITGRLEKMQ